MDEGYELSTFPPPREFQDAAHNALREGVKNGHRLQCVMAPTGSGKTYLGMRIIHEALLRGKRAMFICDRTTLINQTSAVADSYGLSAHSVMQAQHWRYKPDSKFQIASVQTLARRGWPEADVIIVDECFVAGTEIATPSGPKPIELVRSGELVYNATGVGVVLGTSATPTNEKRIVTVRLDNGTEIKCTEEHKFFTTESWIPARLLAGKSLIGIEIMPDLWGGNDTDGEHKRKGGLAGSFRKNMAGAKNLLEILREEIEKPNALGGVQKKNVTNACQDRPSAETTRRERDDIYRASNCAIASSWRGLGGGVYLQNKEEECRGVSAPLQAGHCEPTKENSNRGGRLESLLAQEKASRRKERCAFGIARVVSVQIEERGSNQAVYNLHISGHPSYFAGGALVHNCHTLYKSWTEHVVNCDAFVVGLSATPFSPGMGNIFTNLINAATMDQLTRDGTLVPMRVMSGTRIDMRGAKTMGGEWTDGAAAERGTEIIGDVVTEWAKYAENRKTIIFGATIAHCEEMARQFNEAGFMAATFTADTTPETRAELLKEYAKPDSLRILISVEALAKGFDVKDVGCICDCRPLRKSLSTAIQMWGRGLRSSPETGKTDCVLRGTLILTDKGEVEIQNVTLDHKVWDGINFVDHCGAVCRGVRPVIRHDGLTATPDHEVMTNDGWTRFEDAARRKQRVIVTGIGGTPIRFGTDSLSKDRGQRREFEGRGKVSSLFSLLVGFCQQYLEQAKNSSVPKLQWAQACSSPQVAVPALPRVASTLHEYTLSFLRKIRCSRHSVSFPMCERCGAVGGRLAWYQGSQLGVGQNRQQRALRARKHSMGNACCEYEQYKRVGRKAVVHCFSKKSSRSTVFGQHPSPVSLKNDGSGNCGTMESSIVQAEGEVWDILNAGPLQRFTAGGLLVHNCLLLDFSGNIQRFADDYADIFYNGLAALDSGEKLDKAIRKDDEEKEPKACPKCGYKPVGKRCVSCGWEHVAVSHIEHEAGEMMEFMVGKATIGDKLRVWEESVTYCRGTGKPETAKGRAAHLYKSITGVFPRNLTDFDATRGVPISRAVMNKARANMIAYTKGRA